MTLSGVFSSEMDLVRLKRVPGPDPIAATIFEQLEEHLREARQSNTKEL